MNLHPSPPDLANFQAAAAQQGEWFEDTCIQVLEASDFTITARLVYFWDAGVEVDIIANSRQEIAFYITCKGSYRGDRPGCRRTDTLKKAVGDACALHEQGWGPVLLLTSHLPNTPSGIAMLRSVAPEFLFDAIEPLNDSRRLRWLAHATEAQLRADLAQRRTLFTGRPPRGYGPWPGQQHGR